MTGPSHVVDGDTVDVGDIRVRLKGVDASERHTDLGKAAKIIMQTIVGGSDLTCHLTGEKTRRREVGYCVTAGGTDINREIIAQGAALACPRFDARYLPFEQAEQQEVQARAAYCIKRVR
ncbi:MAG: nuclease [Bradyrhizobium sp.]|nr:nuclease [Bradyrhizobium sp.]